MNPGHVLDTQFLNILAREKSVPSQDRILMPKVRKALDEMNQGLALFLQLPVDPAYLVVLTVSIVVAALCTAEFVAGKHHRRALRKEQRGQHVAYLPLAQVVDCRIIGRPFESAVPRTIIGTAVVVILAVRFVVFLVVSNKIVQCEAVVSRDEVDAGPWPSSLVIERLTGRAQPFS